MTYFLRIAISFRFLSTLAWLAISQSAWCEDPLSLQDCVQLALQKSPDRAISEGRLAQAGALLGKAYAPFSPQAAITGTQTQFGYDQLGVLNKSRRWDDATRSAEIDVSWNIFNGFRDMDRLRVARWNRAATAEALTSTGRQVAVETVRAYYGILLADRTITAQKENLRSKEEHLELARARFKAGVRPYSDVLNAQIQMKQSEIRKIGQEAGKKSALYALNILLDRPLNFPTSVADNLTFEPTHNDLDDNISSALARRPEVVQAVAELHSATAGRSLAYHDFLPLLTIGGAYDYKLTGLPRNTVGRNPYWQVNLGASFRFWDGGTNLHEISRAHAGVGIAEKNLEKARRAVSREVAEWYLALDKNRRIYEIARDQVSAAKEDMDIVAERYKNGAASILEVVDAQANLLRVQLDAIESLYSFHIATFELKRAAGLNPLELEGVSP